MKISMIMLPALVAALFTSQAVLAWLRSLSIGAPTPCWPAR